MNWQGLVWRRVMFFFVAAALTAQAGAHPSGRTVLIGVNQPGHVQKS